MYLTMVLVWEYTDEITVVMYVARVTAAAFVTD